MVEEENRKALKERCRAGLRACLNGESGPQLREELNMPVDELEFSEVEVEVSDGAEDYGEPVCISTIRFRGVGEPEDIGYYRLVERMEGSFNDEFFVLR